MFKKRKIITFPTGKEVSNNIFAKFKGLNENYYTNYLILKKNILLHFMDMLFLKNIFEELGGWPEGSKYDFIMEHEGFAKIIVEKGFKIYIDDSTVDHYHRKNLSLFKNIYYRSYILTLKLFRKEVIFDKEQKQ